MFADHATDFVEFDPADPLSVERRVARQELVEQDPQRVDVGPGIHAAVGRHVLSRADTRHLRPGFRQQAEVGELELAVGE